MYYAYALSNHLKTPTSKASVESFHEEIEFIPNFAATGVKDVIMCFHLTRCLAFVWPICICLAKRQPAIKLDYATGMEQIEIGGLEQERGN